MPAKTLSKKQPHLDKVAKVKADQLNNEPAITPVAPNNEGLPDGWRSVKLANISESIQYGYTESSSLKKIGPKFLRITDIQDYKVNWDDVPYCKIDKEIVSKYLLKKDDLVFARTGATVGKSFLIRTEIPEAVFASYLIRVRIKEETDMNFISYFFNSPNYWSQISEGQVGIGQPNVNGTKLGQLEIPLPPLPEQHAIVSKIEELLSELDKGKQQLETAQQQLKIYRQAVLKWAFEGKLTNKNVKEGELPKGWSQVCVKDIAETYGGYAFKSGDFKDEGTYQVLRMGNVRPGVLRFNESPVFLNKVDDNVLSRSLLKINDVIITQTGTRKKRDYGFTALISKDNLLLNQRIAAIRVKENYLAKFFLYFTWTDFFKDQFFENETGNVGQGNVGMKAVTETLIPFCSIEEQHLIVQEIESRLSVCDKVEETITTSLAQAETLRQSILKKAFEGKLISQVESDNVRALTQSLSVTEDLSIAAEPTAEYRKKNKQAQVPFPRKIEGISTTDLHAGVLAMVIDAHEKSKEHGMKLSHVKGEKIAHLVEAHIGIDLGRVPQKDAAGPDDFPHLKKVESRAIKSNWFGVKKLKIGQTYSSKSGMTRIIQKLKSSVPDEEFKKIEALVQTFLPFELEHAEVIATVYAGWNNLQLEGKTPTDEEIVYESRENWSKRKLGIERASFFKALMWMKEHGYVPTGRGKVVLQAK